MPAKTSTRRGGKRRGKRFSVSRKDLPFLIAVGLLALLLIGALSSCGTHHASPADKASASAAASQIANSPQAKALEAKALACLKAHDHGSHVIRATYRCTFPQGVSHKVKLYAIRTFTPAVLTTSGPGSARDRWVNGLATYAVSQGQG